MKRCAISAAILATLLLASQAQAVTTTIATWTGVPGGEWFDDVLGANATNWNNDGVHEVLGRANGWREAGYLTQDVEIVLSGANAVGVHYDAELNGDFHIRSDTGGTGLLRIEDGATLELESNDSIAGLWTYIDAKGIRVTGAGSTLSRTATNPAHGGGAFIFGSWHNDPGEKMDLEILDGGTVDNSGQMWFGAWDDSEPNLDITWTVGEKATLNNHDYLQGGISYGQPGLDPDAAINFIYNYDSGNSGPATNDYDIDITGHGGRVQVGTGQIKTQVKYGPAATDWVTTVKTYEALYADGLLLSSGSNAGAFGDSFSVSGSTGDAVYSVTNITGAVAGGSHPGDINGDCLQNALDAGTMFANFGAGAGSTLAQGNLNGSIDVDAADAGILFANWTGDPGPADGGAIAEYNCETGEIIVSVDGVNNWFVQSASLGLTGAAPAGIGNFGAVSDNDEIIGETAFNTFSYQDVNLGAVAAMGLPEGDLTIASNAGFGAPLVTVDVVHVGECIIPEPATLALTVLGLIGIGCRQRKRAKVS